jgi:ABC-2 type transport system permease protein/oleandomycin transport system permease protein
MTEQGTAPAPGQVEFRQGGKLGWVWADSVSMTWRNLVSYMRNPEGMFFSSVQPIMFVVLFRYVFGGAVNTGSLPYVDFLMPGIFVQTVGFGVIGTAIGLAEDRQKGAIERFRSLPMAAAAVLAGRTAADTVRNVFVIILLTVVGYAVGFRIHTNPLAFLGGCLLLLLFGHALQWGAAILGLGAPDSETAQLMIFPVLFPFTFASSAFVPVQSMPGWLQAFAHNQPITAIVDASRALMVGGPTTEPLLKALAWCVGLLVVLVPLAVRKYARMT